MSDELIRAHLNLYAVLQNIEDLVKLDPGMADFSRTWNVSLQFLVKNGPSAYLQFQDGVCRHGFGSHPKPSIKLYFPSPAHVNRMFDGKGNPIPLKGFTRIFFLLKKFPKLTERLEYYLKPDGSLLADPEYMKVNTTLTLYTAAFAVRELAALEPTSKKIIAATPDGVLQIGVLPEGPYVHLEVKSGAITVHKGAAEKPSATMSFRTLQVANDLLGGRIDAFQAVAFSDVQLRGVIPIIDNVGLILDRAGKYLA